MKIVLAPDKYKGSITGLEFCDIVEPILKSRLNADVLRLPLADGGDGTIEVVDFYLSAELVRTTVSDPLFRPVDATYLFSRTSKVAFIEMAEASGIKLLQPQDQNCMNTSTYGTGELIRHAIDNGAEQIILGIGGSATNDCGIGMANALGYKFLDANHQEIKPMGRHLNAIAHIDTESVHKKLNDIRFQIACDVKNPLYGNNGSAYVYARQKGASDKDIEYLDKGLQNISKVIDHKFGINPQAIIGAGAAGGMGAGTVVFLGGQLVPGIELIMQIADFKNKVKGADWIVTGEGKLDHQTLSGKALSGIIEEAKQNQIKVATFCGGTDLNAEEIKKMGIAYSATIMEKSKNLEDALNNTTKYLKLLAEEFTASF